MVIRVKKYNNNNLMFTTMKKTYIIPKTEVVKVMASQMIALSLNESSPAAYDESDFLNNEVKDDRGGFFAKLRKQLDKIGDNRK